MSKLGHSCKGGGAKIENCPIHIHVHIHTQSEPLIHKVKRGIYELIGRRTEVIEKADLLSSTDIQRKLVQRLED